MFSAPGVTRAVHVLLFATALSCVVAFPQTPQIPGPAGYSFSAGHALPALGSCSEDAALATLALPRSARSSNPSRSSCDVPTVPAAPLTPCNFPGVARADCASPADLVHTDPVQAELEAGGKEEHKISRAREKVLDILETENACLAWYRGKDPNPASTFRTLSFALDRRGEQFVEETREPDSTILFRQPYVAKVFQAEGAYSTVTVNSNGAFFHSVAAAHETFKDRPSYILTGVRILKVGPYEGGTLRAQVLSLLHEFGHVLDLLPGDLDNVDGKSMQNTQEVLGHCRAEIDSSSRRNTLSAKR